MDSAKICCHGYVSGRVQGVSFRAFTRSCAVQRGLTGWAHNLADGRVEFTLCGPQSDVELVLAELRQGPPAARVDRLDWQQVDWRSLTGFEIS